MTRRPYLCGAVQADPKISTRQVSIQIGVSQSKDDSVLRNNNLYSYHIPQVRQLYLRDEIANNFLLLFRTYLLTKPD